MTLGQTIFDAAYASLPDLRAQLRVARKTVVPKCLVASVGAERVETEQGLALTPDISVRLPTTSVPATGCRVGDSVEVSRDEAVTWRFYRISAITESAGMTRLTMEDVDNAG
jgi:hypothetical protein